MDDMQLGNRTAYVWMKNTPMGSANKTISANKFACLENMSNLDQDKRITSLPLSGYFTYFYTNALIVNLIVAVYQSYALRYDDIHDIIA